MREGNISNYKELPESVIILETMKEKRELLDAKTFLFTDIIVAKYEYDKEKSPYKLLFDLIVKLYKIYMYGEIILHVIWIREISVIKYGIDRVYRGTTNQGVHAFEGKMLMYIVPFNPNGEETSEILLKWSKD